MVRKCFGLVVKRFRRKLGISQEELAWNASMHRTYLADIERGKRNVSLTRMVALIYALRTTPSEFFFFLEQELAAMATVEGVKVKRPARRSYRQRTSVRSKSR